MLDQTFRCLLKMEGKHRGKTYCCAQCGKALKSRQQVKIHYKICKEKAASKEKEEIQIPELIVRKKITFDDTFNNFLQKDQDFFLQQLPKSV